MMFYLLEPTAVILVELVALVTLSLSQTAVRSPPSSHLPPLRSRGRPGTKLSKLLRKQTKTQKCEEIDKMCEIVRYVLKRWHQIKLKV